MTKPELRARIRTLKQAYTKEQLIEKSILHTQQIMAHPEVLKADNVLVYWSLSDEVHTHALVQELALTKRVYLPVVRGADLDIIEFTGLEHMQKVPPYGIREPMGEPITDLTLIDVALIPGMAFDKSGNRLGRGKAYYDGLLPSLNCKKIGLCFDFQFIEVIPVEAHDIPMDEIVHD